MSGQHTQGRLSVNDHGKEVGQGGVRYCDLIVPSTTGHHHTTIASMIPEPDARRLAACWNNAEGMPTEEIETGMLLVQVRGKINEQACELAAARALLEKVGCMHILDVKVGKDLAERILSFLKGGA